MSRNSSHRFLSLYHVQCQFSCIIHTCIIRCVRVLRITKTRVSCHWLSEKTNRLRLDRSYICNNEISTWSSSLEYPILVINNCETPLEYNVIRSVTKIYYIYFRQSMKQIVPESTAAIDQRIEQENFKIHEIYKNLILFLF